MAFTGFFHVRQECFGAIQYAVEVDVHDPLVVFDRQIAHSTRQSNTGVVEYQVGFTVIGDHLISPCIEGVFVRHIQLLAGDVDRILLQNLDGFCQASFVYVAQSYVTALLCQVDRQCASDTRTGTCDCCYFTAQIFHFFLLQASGRRLKYCLSSYVSVILELYVNQTEIKGCFQPIYVSKTPCFGRICGALSACCDRCV